MGLSYLDFVKQLFIEDSLVPGNVTSELVWRLGMCYCSKCTIAHSCGPLFTEELDKTEGGGT